jgi:hypothetical protein
MQRTWRLCVSDADGMTCMESTSSDNAVAEDAVRYAQAFVVLKNINSSSPRVQTRPEVRRGFCCIKADQTIVTMCTDTDR